MGRDRCLIFQTTLASSSFRVLNIASDADFAELRRTRQEVYSNLETADIDSAEVVSRALSSYPYDLHIVLDVPPLGFSCRLSGTVRHPC